MILDAFASLPRRQFVQAIVNGIPEIPNMHHLLQTSQWEQHIQLQTWQVEAIDTLRMRGGEWFAHRDGIVSVETEEPTFIAWDRVAVDALEDDMGAVETLIGSALGSCQRRDWKSAIAATNYNAMTERGWCSYLWSPVLDAAQAAFAQDKPFAALDILARAVQKAASAQEVA